MAFWSQGKKDRDRQTDRQTGPWGPWKDWESEPPVLRSSGLRVSHRSHPESGAEAEGPSRLEAGRPTQEARPQPWLCEGGQATRLSEPQCAQL